MTAPDGLMNITRAKPVQFSPVVCVPGHEPFNRRCLQEVINFNPYKPSVLFCGTSANSAKRGVCSGSPLFAYRSFF